MRKNKIWAVLACAAALAACELGGTTELPSYTVVYNANGGGGSMKNSVHKYSETKELNANAFTRANYFFVGWAETPEGAVKYADRQSVKNLAKEDGATVKLYALWKPIPVVDVPGANLAAKLSWLQTNAQSNTNYTVEVTTDESIDPRTLSYGNRSKNIGIILKGTDTTRIIDLSSNGAMFGVNSGVTLTLDNNITLRGRSNNTDSLVNVFTGGRLVMNAGSAITGNNTSSYSSDTGYGYGGGVYVGNGGTFTMNGGTISGNTAYAGGGVYVGGGTFTMSGGTISGNTATTTSSSYSSYGGGVAVPSRGTFTKTGGTIYGYSASDTVNSNAVKNSSGTVVSNRGHAVYASGKRKETTAGPSVNLRFNYNGGSSVFSGAWDN